MLMSAEYAPADKRGRYGMFTLLGGGTAAVLSSLTFLGVNVTIGENSPAFLEWGWRIPFLISAVLIAIALYVRLRIAETPVFVAEKARDTCYRAAPIAELLRLRRREIVLGRRQHPGRHVVRLHGEHLSHPVCPRRIWATRRSFIWAVGRAGRAGQHHLRCPVCDACPTGSGDAG